eukprot:489922-Rhodomonas_salina.1
MSSTAYPAPCLCTYYPQTDSTLAYAATHSPELILLCYHYLSGPKLERKPSGERGGGGPNRKEFSAAALAISLCDRCVSRRSYFNLIYLGGCAVCGTAVAHGATISL